MMSWPFADQFKRIGREDLKGRAVTRVKLCLDAGCSRQILLEDGRCIVEIKDKCTAVRVPRDFKLKSEQIARETKRQIILSGELFKGVREGCDLEI